MYRYFMAEVRNIYFQKDVMAIIEEMQLTNLSKYINDLIRGSSKSAKLDKLTLEQIRELKEMCKTQELLDKREQEILNGN